MAKVKRAVLRESNKVLRERLTNAESARDGFRSAFAAQAEALRVAEDEAFTALASVATGKARVRVILRAAGGGQTRPDIAKVRRLCREYLDSGS